MSQYVAWDGETYQGDPPDGWSIRSDGRWWPDKAPPTIQTPAEVATKQGSQRRQAIVAIVIVIFVLLGLGLVASVATRSPLEDAASDLRGGCDDVTQTASGPIAVAWIDSDSSCARAVGSAAGTLGFTADQLRSAMSGSGGSAFSNDGYRIEAVFDGRLWLMSFSER